MTSVPIKRCLSRNFTFLKRTCLLKNFPEPLIIRQIKYHNFSRNQAVFQPKYATKLYGTHDNKPATENDPEDPKPGLIKRFKQMYRDYWYVLVPVHLVTSAGWFGGFYYLAKSGVDIVALLQSMGVSETLTNPLKDSSMGYLAISYALYKIATPIRYTVTLGGTTLSINYLKEFGYIKPVPSKEKLREMYHERKNSFRETIEETREELRQRKDQLKERKDNIMGDYVTFKKELKDIKTK